MSTSRLVRAVDIHTIIVAFRLSHPPKRKKSANAMATQNHVHSVVMRRVEGLVSAIRAITRSVKPLSSICCWAACFICHIRFLLNS